MALSEFDLISRYFNQSGLAADPAQHTSVVLGIGDDCALLSIAPDQQLAVSMDVLVETVHFPAGADATLIAERALAVNLSDLAAMGARPLGFTLGLTLPRVDERWLQSFSHGLRESALRYRCPLLGGDTTRGPLQIAIQVHGLVPAGTALTRSGAKVGDDVYVSGILGRAGLALSVLQNTLPAANAGQRAELLAAYYQPQARLALGSALRGIASAAQDVSDGVLADLAHIAGRSRVGLQLEAAAIPVAPVVRALCDSSKALELALTAGDDYELVFTAAPAERAAVLAAGLSARVAVTRIGVVVAGSGVEVSTGSGELLQFAQQGFQHF